MQLKAKLSVFREHFVLNMLQNLYHFWKEETDQFFCCSTLKKARKQNIFGFENRIIQYRNRVIFHLQAGEYNRQMSFISTRGIYTVNSLKFANLSRTSTTQLQNTPRKPKEANPQDCTMYPPTVGAKDLQKTEIENPDESKKVHSSRLIHMMTGNNFLFYYFQQCIYTK